MVRNGLRVAARPAGNDEAGEGTSPSRPPGASRRASLLDARGLGARGVQGEGAGVRLDAPAVAPPRPDRGPAVGYAERDAGADGEAGGARRADGNAQPSRGGEGTLAGAAGGGQGEGRGGRGATADVRDAAATTGLWRAAGAAGERAPAAVGDRAAVLAQGSARGGLADGRTRAIGTTQSGAEDAVGAVALLGRLIHDVVAAERPGRRGRRGRRNAARSRDEQRRPARACFARLVEHAVSGRTLDREAVDAVAADDGGQVEVHDLPARHRPLR